MMADYRSDWDVEIREYSRKWLNKHPGDLTADEAVLLRAFIAAENRLRRVDEFIGSLR